MLNRRDDVRKCYVCLREIKEENPVYLTEGIYRHTDCYAGSPKWLKSKVAQKSKYYSLFTIEGELCKK